MSDEMPENEGMQHPVVCLPYDPSALPRVPKTIRYHDDYSNGMCRIPNADTADTWSVKFGGRSYTVNLRPFDETLRPIFRSWAWWTLVTVSPRSAVAYTGALSSIGGVLRGIIGNLLRSPHEAQSFWKIYVVGGELGLTQRTALKCMLRFYCDVGVTCPPLP